MRLNVSFSLRVVSKFQKCEPLFHEWTELIVLISHVVIQGKVDITKIGETFPFFIGGLYSLPFLARDLLFYTKCFYITAA